MEREEPLKQILDKVYKLAKDSCPKWFYDEVEEDLDKSHLAKVLGVVVHRPKPFDFSKMYGTLSKVQVTILTTQEIYI